MGHGGRSQLPRQASLDGLRGAAVVAVLAYHLGWIAGGFLGVSLFFTLSGYLITNLLLTERAESDGIDLGRFWARRARRLLPAAVLGIALAVTVTAVGGAPDQLRAITGDTIGALGYVANWRFVLAHDAYHAGYAAPSALLHYWSLAIEEQLYIVLPLVLLAVARLGFRRRQLVLVLGVLLAGSAAATWMVGAGDPNRVYFGTDTRMFELLAGALLAVVIGFPGPDDRRRRWAGRLGAVAAAAVGILWVAVDQQDRWLYRGGFWVVAVLSCGLIVGAVWGRGLGRVLQAPVLTALGRVSYGLYVYHWPLFILLSPSRTGLDGPGLVIVRLAATGALATASYLWVELPIRNGRRHLPRVTLPAIPALVAVIVVASLVASGWAGRRSVISPAHDPVVLAAATSPIPPTSASITRSPSPAGRPTSGTPALPPVTGPTDPRHAAPTQAGTGAARAAPARVLFMGDSLVQEAFPTFAERLRRQGVASRVTGGGGQSLMTHGAAWLTQLGQSVAGFDPEVVVLESCCGQFRFDAPLVTPGGRVVAEGSPGFEAEWRRLALEASAIASSRGALVLWVLGPPTHTNGWYGPIDGEVPKINAVYRSLASCTAEMGFVDWGVVAGPGGAYADALPDGAGHPVQVRQTDGFHFTGAGIDALSNVTLPVILADWQRFGRPGPWPGRCPG